MKTKNMINFGLGIVVFGGNLMFAIAEAICENYLWCGFHSIVCIFIANESISFYKTLKSYNLL